MSAPSLCGPADRKPNRSSDFAYAKGLVFNDAPAHAPEREAGALGSVGRVRALDAKTRTEAWTHSVREASVYSSGSVLGEEATKVTNKPDDGDHEDWSPDVAPGGDLISWDAASGEEEWRVETPGDAWCSPRKLGTQVYVTCETDLQAPPPPTTR